MPRMMQHIMVKNSATMVGSITVTLLLTDTTAEMSLDARPVVVMQPAITPAIAQATATVMVPLPPASSASIILPKVRRFSLFRKPTIMATNIAMVAEVCMVRTLVETMTTRTMSGKSR